MFEDIINYFKEHWLLIAVVLYALFLTYKWFKNKSPKEYKEIDLKKEVKSTIKDYLDIYSEKYPLTWGYDLRIGYNKIGLIKRISSAYSIFEKYDFTKKKVQDIKKVVVVTKEQLEKEKQQKVPKEQKKVLIFETYKDSLGGKIKFLLGFKPEYFIIDEDIITKEGVTYSINPTSSFGKFLTINIFSKQTRDYIEDISFKITREEELKQLVNFTPRMVYLEGESAKYRQKGQVLADLEKAKKNQAEGLTKG